MKYLKPKSIFVLIMKYLSINLLGKKNKQSFKSRNNRNGKKGK